MVGVWAAATCDEWFRGLLMYRRWKRRQWLKYAHRTRDKVTTLKAEGAVPLA
jgi:Na+-driven multidrug efflux pump